MGSRVHIYMASAGTAKTTTLLDTISDYIAAGVPVDRIAFVTFTRAGAEVARQRTASRFKIDPLELKHFKTIHSLCYRAVKANRTNIMDYVKYQDFGQQAGYDLTQLGEYYSEGINWNIRQDEQLVAAEQLYRANRKYYEQVMLDRIDQEELVQYMKYYESFKRINNYMDFTDLLQEYIARDLREDVDVVCLDEMQDSSLLQWQVLFKAFRNAQHIHIAGDIKQKIFAWAGASDTMLEIKGERHFLDISYRVPSQILDFTNRHIVTQMIRQDGTNCKAAKEGGSVDTLVNVEEISNIYDDSKTYFFLARNKKFFAPFIEWCKQNGLPYCIKGEPIFSEADKISYREGRTDDWDEAKLDFAQYCYSRGTFYRKPNINISTIHGVKGDEADVVVLRSDITRAVSSQLDVDEDAEHCVFYVACTRAREALYIIQPQTSFEYPYLF